MSGHWSSAKIHFEDFTPPGAMTTPEDVPFTIRLARSGAVLDVLVGQTILEVLRAHGHDVPSSCESGTCGSCRTKLIAGEVDHRDLALADYEKADNIMVCVSRAMGGEIILDL